MNKNSKKIKKNIKNFSTGMKILAIETSCDETSIAVLEVKNKKPTITDKVNFKILGSEISSQIDIHKEFGGVFPALAKREHVKNLPIVLEKVLGQSDKGLTMEKIDIIAVTTGPGLEPSLWTGIVFAKELSQKYKIPIVPINHMEGHIFSIFPKDKKTFSISKKEFESPVLSLLVSGGHTELVLVENLLECNSKKIKYKKIGQTRDDAVGEAFDKVARMLELPYPGGPEIGKLANMERKSIVLGGLESATARARGIFQQKNIRASQNTTLSDIVLPRPMIHSKDYDFSFSGLKTAVLYLIRDLKEKDPNVLENIKIKQMIAREFEDAVVETLIFKTIKAIKEHKIKTLIVGGGVSANKYLQEEIKKSIKKLNKETNQKIKVYFPTKSLTGDNATMIAIAGYFNYKNKKIDKNNNLIKANGSLSL